MIRLVGWRGLGITHNEERRAQTLMNRRLHRLSGLLTSVNDVSIHVKEASKTGKKHRYEAILSIHADAVYHARASGWDLSATLAAAFDSLESQIPHRSWSARNHIYERLMDFPEPLLRL